MSLVDALAQIKKQHGAGALFKLGSRESLKVEVFSTGCSALDTITGIGGLPKGRIVEIYGPEAGGKTTLTLQTVAQIQKAGGKAAFIDAEHSLDPDYAKALGVDTDNLYVCQPDNGEQGLEIAESLIRSGEVDCVVIDSVAALVPKSELEGDMGDAQMGLMARLMSQALRKLTAVVHQSNCLLIFINQVRDKLGIVFGNPETTTGGRALKFYASMRIDIRRISQIKKGENIIGANTKIKIVKNKLSAPFRDCQVKMIYGKGLVND